MGGRRKFGLFTPALKDFTRSLNQFYKTKKQMEHWENDGCPVVLHRRIVSITSGIRLPVPDSSLTQDLEDISVCYERMISDRCSKHLTDNESTLFDNLIDFVSTHSCEFSVEDFISALLVLKRWVRKRYRTIDHELMALQIKSVPY